MALICINGCKECTGCMKCWEDNANVLEYIISQAKNEGYVFKSLNEFAK